MPVSTLAPAKSLGNKSSAVPSDFHQLVDQKFHRMDSTARIAIAHMAVRQQDMIHTAGAK
jgi:hypothetical protein